MGSSSSVLQKLDYSYDKNDEESKEEPIDDNFGYIFQSIGNNNGGEIQSAVWYSIHAIMKTISAIRTDFRNEKNTAILYNVLKKVMINIDSIYNIQDTTFEYGKIQRVNDEMVKLVIERLSEYYETKPLIIIKIHNNQKMIDLERFTYGIFTFTVSDGYLCVYV